MEELERKDKKFCECGCGKLLHKPRSPSETRRFISGHNQRGKRPWNYKGVRNSKGYLFEGLKRQHRLVYERYYKCCLLSWIHIHHINENKKDNRIENLIPLTIGRHSILHCTKDMSGRVCSICGTNTTRLNKHGWTYWYKHNDGFLCDKCYNKFKRKRK